MRRAPQMPVTPTHRFITRYTVTRLLDLYVPIAMEIDTIALGLRSWNYTSYTSPCILISSNYYTSASTVAEDVGHLKNDIQKLSLLRLITIA